MFKILKSSHRVKVCKSIDKLFDVYHNISHKLNTTTKELQKMVRYSVKHNLPLDEKYLCTDEIVHYDELNVKPNKATNPDLNK